MAINNRVVQERPVLFRPNMTAVTAKEKVTYYARVSTENDEQEDSYERQKEHFEEKIMANPKWEYVPGYADWGVTGTKAEARKNFIRMIDDCRAGKINRILVKSISRFARNTVDTLMYIRELRERGISVFFETQNIDTMSASGDVLITILAAMAEQESRTMSTNIKWAYQKRFKDGQVLINPCTLGYKKEGDEYANALQNYAEDTRAYELLKATIDDNPVKGYGKEIFERIKQIFSRGEGIKDKEFAELRELGFEVVSEKNHYKIVFKGDEKYWFPISKTPSDGRSGKNLASNIIKRLSIYK